MAGSITTSLLSKALGLNFGNLNDYPTVSNGYYVALGSFLTSFSKVSGIVLKSSEITAINEGGSNRPFLLRSQKRDFNTITFEKGYGTLDIMNLINKVTVMTVIIKGNNGSIQGIYYTDRCIVQSVSLSDLEAGESKPLIQTLTVAYHTLKRQEQMMTALSYLSLAGVNTSFVNSAFSQQVREKAKEEKKQKEKEEEIRKIKEHSREDRKKKHTEKPDLQQQVVSENQNEQKKKEGNQAEQNIQEALTGSTTRLAWMQNQKAEQQKDRQKQQKEIEEENRKKELENLVQFD